MILSNHATVVFRSTPEWYERERQGYKPNTLRLLSRSEYIALSEFDPEHIRIQRGDDEGTCFTRRVLSIYQVADLLGQALVMVCWYD